jgi:recombination protein RecA
VVVPSAKSERPSKALKNDDVVRLIGRLRDAKIADPRDVMLASETAYLSDVREWIPTGFAGLDEIFGGGWAVGRVSEVFGAEGAGKSALAHAAIVACQKNGGLVVYLDFEHSLEKKTLVQLGIDQKRLLYLTPAHIEQGWDLVFAVLEEWEANPPKSPNLIVWDSFGASPPKAAFEADSQEENQPAAAARAIGNGCTLLFRKIARAKAHALVINQERTVMGGGGRRGGFQGPEYQTTGGKAKLYTFSLRARVARVMTVKTEGTSGASIGYLIAVSTKKNKSAPPHQQARFYLDFKHGPSPLLTVYHVLKDANRIRSVGAGKYTGSWAGGRKFGKGDEWLAALAEDPELLRLATESYLEVVRAGGAKAALGLDLTGSSLDALDD